ncbi:MAG: hypothetical protein NWF03_02530 [Candidatus Bathyarchaeota archaeon]|nr:hypothetical protein [Candidatus Bathyarchaeota archaeon]
METSSFFYFVLPLGILVFFLVGLVVYYARKQDDEYERELKKLRKNLLSGKMTRPEFINMRTRLKHEKTFNTESKKLLAMLSEEKVDNDTYVRLRHVLETNFKERIEKLEANTAGKPSKKESFDASRY